MEIKAGTRCECTDSECVARHVTCHFDCFEDAVRMVTVRVGERNASARPDAVPVKAWERGIFGRFPMCAACADWHEKRLDAEAERMTGQFDAPEAE